MLKMTSAEVKLRHGSLLIWHRYTFSDRYDLTIESVPVRLLSVVGNNRQAKTLKTAPRRLRVIDPETKLVHDIETHYLVDPTRTAAPTITYTPGPKQHELDRFKAARNALRHAGR